MSDTFAIPADALGDTPPDGMTGDADAAPVQCAEPGCLNAVVKPARGRTPKYCPEHQGNKSAKTTTRKAVGFKGSVEVEATLKQYFAFLGGIVELADPYDGQVIAQGGPAVAHELVVLAGTDIKLRKYLIAMSAPGKYGALTMSVFAIVFPIVVHHGLIPQFSIFGKKDEATGGES